MQEGIWENNSFKYAQRITRRGTVQKAREQSAEVKKELEELKELQKKMAGLERWNTPKSERMGNVEKPKKSIASENDKSLSGSLISKLQEVWSSLFGSSAKP